MKKLQQFYIYKFLSGRLIESDCDIRLSPKEARENGEMVSIGQNQVIRSIQKIKAISYNQKDIDDLLKERKRLLKEPSSYEISKEILSITKKIDDILFIPEIISITIERKSHYKKLLNGLKINGISYNRLLAGAGNIRRDTIIFAANDIRDKLVEFLEVGRDKSIPLIPSKFSAYFSLSNSATHSVSTPRFCVIPDCEVERIITSDCVIEDDKGNNDIETKDISVKFNLFDGEGLVSVDQSRKWANELQINYIPATFIIRGPYTKGLLITFDIHDFCNKKNKYVTKDVWGDEVDLRYIDVIFTASQVKLWSTYVSKDDFLRKCGDFGYGISRVSVKKDKNYTRTNYQFLQVLKLNDDQIKCLCQNTIDYFKFISGLDRNRMILYLTGGNGLDTDNPLSKNFDPIVKALMINPEMEKDPYIRNHILNSLNKKIKESYLGSLFVEGNYQVMIADPYALMEHAVGINPVGLLSQKEYYSDYWNKRNVKKVIACRAPLTFISEANVLNFKKSADHDYWYKYLNSGIIYNIHGIDCMLHADSDQDGDLVFTSANECMINGVQGGLPIFYAKKLSKKEIVTEENMVKSDINGMHSKIGFITNCSSTTYAMLENLDKNSREYSELYKRLKLYRYFQGENIDKAKNGGAKEIPAYWFKYQKILENDTQEIIEEKKFNNSILIEKRPYFFRYLYSHYNRKYLEELKIYDDYCYTKFGKSVKALLAENTGDLSVDEQEIVNDYYKFSYFIFNPSVMNKVCWHMETNIKSIKDDLKNNLFDWKILIDSDSTHYVKVMLMLEILEKYCRFKKNSKDPENNSYFYDDIDLYAAYLRDIAIDMIASNIRELASLAVYCSYVVKKGFYDFAWKLFPDGVLLNLLKNTAKDFYDVPVESANGDIEHLWGRYELKTFSLDRHNIFGQNIN